MKNISVINCEFGEMPVPVIAVAIPGAGNRLMRRAYIRQVRVG
jgi:hypothetical protein